MGGGIMPDVFISYSTIDERFARAVQATFAQHGLSAFLACTSLKPGEVWADKIRTELQASPTLICLMSKAASTSAFVNQEFGMAIHGQKTIIPVVWDMDPADLPGWLGKYQALDLRNCTMADYAVKLNAVAAQLRSKRDKQQLLLMGGLVALTFIMIFAGNK